MPQLLADPQAVLHEVGTDAVLYVIDVADAQGRVAKLVVRLDMIVKVASDLGRARVPMNIVRTATMMDDRALRDRVRYQVIWGAV